MSMEMYKGNLKRKIIYRKLDTSEKQIEQGMTKDANKALNSLKEKYEL